MGDGEMIVWGGVVLVVIGIIVAVLTAIVVTQVSPITFLSTLQLYIIGAIIAIFFIVAGLLIILKSRG